MNGCWSIRCVPHYQTFIAATVWELPESGPWRWKETSPATFGTYECLGDAVLHLLPLGVASIHISHRVPLASLTVGLRTQSALFYGCSPGAAGLGGAIMPPQLSRDDSEFFHNSPWQRWAVYPHTGRNF